MGKAGDARAAGNTETGLWRNLPSPCWSLSQKADKSALASKVSRIQFDATTEQLNHMMQELVAKMSGQEQDWQKLLDKLLAEMDSKVRLGEDVGQVGLLLIPGPAIGTLPLSPSIPPPIYLPPRAHLVPLPQLDRLELDPLKQMLEDRWKSLRQQLKERSPLYQADEAAAMRR